MLYCSNHKNRCVTVAPPSRWTVWKVLKNWFRERWRTHFIFLRPAVREAPPRWPQASALNHRTGGRGFEPFPKSMNLWPSPSSSFSLTFFPSSSCSLVLTICHFSPRLCLYITSALGIKVHLKQYFSLWNYMPFLKLCLVSWCVHCIQVEMLIAKMNPWI